MDQDVRGRMLSSTWQGIRRKFGVRYHNHHVPRLLHPLGFSVQRSRKRLARADREPQETWLKKRLPAIKNGRSLPWRSCLRGRGELLAGWEPHRTWSRVGVQPRVDTYGLRRTAHVFGAASLDKAKFTFQFVPVFNGKTFFEFLRQLVRRYKREND